MKILEELWYGNISPVEREIQPKSRTAHLINLIVRNEDELMPLLSDEAKAVLEKMKDNQAELRDLNEREVFMSGFRLGARIMLEVMDGSEIPFIDD